jgi:hypothetical protein
MAVEGAFQKRSMRYLISQSFGDAQRHQLMTEYNDNMDLLAPSFTLAPFARAVNVRHQSMLLDLKAAQVLV